jgi:hypothetical protein
MLFRLVHRKKSSPRLGKPSFEILEIRCLMAQPDLAMPIDTKTDINGVLFWDHSTSFPNAQKPPAKTITITNNSDDQTVYPFLRDVNSRTANPKDPNDLTPQYDPYDKLNQEYRGYIGYKTGSGDLFGLLPHQSITVTVPLVFWDAGRLEIATDASNLAPPDNAKANPFHFRLHNADGSTTAHIIQDSGTMGANHGVVMWYHATTPEAPANDAPDQLTEMTMRDPYLATLPTASTIPASEKMALINYDVSYVDSMVLPVAIEATNVPVPIPKDRNPSPPILPYGWIGSTKSIDDLQKAIQNFTSNDPTLNGLGQYFGGKGYTSYNIPDAAVAGIKLPSGQNAIADSPLKLVPSSYPDINGQIGLQYMLTSGGPGPFRQFTGGSQTDTGDTIQLNPDTSAAFLQALDLNQAHPVASVRR